MSQQNSKPEPCRNWLSIGDFFRLPKGIVDRLAEIGHLPGVVYMILASYANNETGECFPSQDTIAALAGGKPRAVRNALEARNKGGLNSKKRMRRDDGGTTCNTYRLLPNTLPNASGSTQQLDEATRRWLTELDPSMHDRIVAVGLVRQREATTLAEFLESFLAKRHDV